MEALGATPPTAPLSHTATLILFAIGPEERHGYGIMSEVARITDGAARLGPGGGYTTIKRLLDDGLSGEAEPRPDPELDDERRRYYRVPSSGRLAAAAEARRLDSLVQAARPWALDAGG